MQFLFKTFFWNTKKHGSIAVTKNNQGDITEVVIKRNGGEIKIDRKEFYIVIFPFFDVAIVRKYKANCHISIGGCPVATSVIENLQSGNTLTQRKEYDPPVNYDSYGVDLASTAPSKCLILKQMVAGTYSKQSN